MLTHPRFFRLSKSPITIVTHVHSVMPPLYMLALKFNVKISAKFATSPEDPHPLSMSHASLWNIATILHFHHTVVNPTRIVSLLDRRRVSRCIKFHRRLVVTRPRLLSINDSAAATLLPWQRLRCRVDLLEHQVQLRLELCVIALALRADEALLVAGEFCHPRGRHLTWLDI